MDARRVIPTAPGSGCDKNKEDEVTRDHHDYIADECALDGALAPPTLAEKVDAIAAFLAYTDEPLTCGDSDDGSPCFMRATMVALPPVSPVVGGEVVPCCEVHAREWARDYDAPTRDIEPTDVLLWRIMQRRYGVERGDAE